MLFVLAYILVVFGVVMSSVCGLMPYSDQEMIPDMFRFVFFIVGIIMSFMGVFLIQGRALKTGVGHLLEYGRPDRIIWFWIQRDGTVKITPAVKEVEGTTYSKELDAIINDFKSYRLFDHSVRFVPEGLGHSVDLDVVLYCTLLRNKYGFANLREARNGKATGRELTAKEMHSFNPAKDFEGYRWED